MQAFVQYLDVSNNKFTEFPKQLSRFDQLITLDISYNVISELPETALKGCNNLMFLYLSNNNISHWAAIKPNTVLQMAVSLEAFSLSGNPLTSLSSIDFSYILTSASLKLLDLSDCRITKVSGSHVLQGNY